MTEVVTPEQFTQEEIALAQAGIAAPFNGLLKPYKEIYEELKRPIHEAFLEERQQGGSKLTYWPWWVGVLYFNKITPGWGWVPNPPVISDGHIGMTGVVYVPTLETGFPGIARGGEGGDYEHLDETKRAKGFDPVLDAARQALKRAFSMHGFGLYLYLPKDLYSLYFK